MASREDKDAVNRLVTFIRDWMEDAWCNIFEKNQKQKEDNVPTILDGTKQTRPYASRNDDTNLYVNTTNVQINVTNNYYGTRRKRRRRRNRNNRRIQ